MAAFVEVEVNLAAERRPGDTTVESVSQTVTYYLASPDRWSTATDAALQARAGRVVERMFADLNRSLQQSEPASPLFLRIKGVRARVLPSDVANSWPWLAAEKPEWETSVAVVAHGDGTYAKVNILELGSAVPAERPSVSMDAILPALVDKQLRACADGYDRALASFHDARPLDERSKRVWGCAILFMCVLDRLASGGDVPDAFGTIERMIVWLTRDAVLPLEDVESAAQIYRRMLQHPVFRPNDSLFEFVYERAWAVRYSDLDPRTPTAFQGFVRCLTACRDSLHAFDLDEPARDSAASAGNAFRAIDAFNRRVVLPALAEMRETLERKGLGVVIAETGDLGDPFLDSYFKEMHPNPRFVRELESTPPSAAAMSDGTAIYCGHTLVVLDAEPSENRYAGKYFETILFDVRSSEEIGASPFVLYHMKFDNKLHAFKHRYDNDRAFRPIGEITKFDIQNHFLGSYDFYKIHAKGDRRPW